MLGLYLDHRRWPELFPATIRAVRLVRDDGASTTLEVDHRTAGLVPNVLTRTGPSEVQLDERKPEYTARFVNRFDPAPGGTRYTVAAEVTLRGWRRALAAVAAPLVRARIRRFVVAPLRARALGG